MPFVASNGLPEASAPKIVACGIKLPPTNPTAYLMATHSNGISALQLQRQLGLGSCKSAWLLCAKLRRSMVARGRSPLSGLVEGDETAIVGRSSNDPLTGGGGRSDRGKMLVVGAVEVADGGAGPGRIRLQQVPDYSAASLHPFLKANLAPGATAKTDGWSGSPGAPGIAREPHAVGRMAALSCCPGPAASSPISNAGRSASITACAASTSKPTSTSSSFASTDAAPGMPSFDRCSASLRLIQPSQQIQLANSGR